MPRMIDVIRNSALPSNTMQFAAKGALLVPAQEMIEILVYLATHNRVFGEQARMTLAGWDEASARAAAANPQSTKEVLDYLIDPKNLRPVLLPLLLENPSIGDHVLMSLAASATREQVEAMLASQRVNQSGNVLNALSSNPTLRAAESQAILEKLAALDEQTAIAESPEPTSVSKAIAVEAAGESPTEEVSDEVVLAFCAEHAAEIAEEAGKAFQVIGGVHEELADEGQASAAAAGVGTTTSTAATVETTPQRKPPAKKWVLSADEQRGSALQKIAKLDIKGRIQLAMKGNKEERSLLIRDGTKIVALAVLESPKVTDGEIEKFASQKNVLEAVLRAIPLKRRFMKMYPVVRNLTFNPRTPIDVSLGLMKNLLVHDLRNLSGNKEVSDTVRKLAMKMFRTKLDVNKK
ncbi:MAG: hypothetical protein WB952_01675 [Terriglobales bacterium]